VKKVFCIFVCFCAVVGLCGSVLAASGSKVKKPQAVTSQPETIKEANPQVEDDKPDDIQKQYLERLINTNAELKHAYLTLLKNVRLTQLQHERIMLELKYRGRVPRDVEAIGQEIKDEERRTEDKKRDLEKDKDNLKLDALKYYHGKMPNWLSQKWNEKEEKHSAYIEENYTLKLKEELQK